MIITGVSLPNLPAEPTGWTLESFFLDIDNFQWPQKKLAMGKQSSTLKPEVLEDLRARTEFSETELQEWYKGFQEDCPSGKLTLQEFEAVYQQLFPQGDASKFAEHVFRTFDTNQDSWLDFREFIVGLSIMSRGTVDERLEWAFSMYDLDGNGTVSHAEALEIVRSICKMMGPAAESPSPEEGNTPEEKTDKMFARMDKNEDGNLTLREFVEAAKKDPTTMKLLQAMN